MRNRLFPLCCAILLGLTACQSNTEIIELAGAIQGTTYHIKIVWEPGTLEITRLQEEIDRTFQDIDLKLSNYRDDSEISQLNGLRKRRLMGVFDVLGPTALGLVRGQA